MSISNIQEMTVIERIHAMEMLWESLCGDDAGLPSPAWHKEVVDARKSLQDAGEATFVTLQQLKQMSRK